MRWTWNTEQSLMSSTGAWSSYVTGTTLTNIPPQLQPGQTHTVKMFPGLSSKGKDVFMQLHLHSNLLAHIHYLDGL